MPKTATATLKRKSVKKPLKKILVVEDQGEVALVLEMVLAGKKVELDYVDTLLSASEYLQQQEPAIILLDNMLPDGFGVDFIRYIRGKYPSIKIIMISAFGTARDIAMENGADVFFEKPFPLEEFNDAIDRLL